MTRHLMGLTEANGPVPVAAIYCHCALVFNCEPASSEVQDQNGLWVPVCERCMQIAWEDGRRVRKLRRQNYDHEGRSLV